MKICVFSNDQTVLNAYREAVYELRLDDCEVVLADPAQEPPASADLKIWNLDQSFGTYPNLEDLRRHNSQEQVFIVDKPNIREFIHSLPLGKNAGGGVGQIAAESAKGMAGLGGGPAIYRNGESRAALHPIAGKAALARRSHGRSTQSSWMKENESLLRQVGASDIPVLLNGETGVGKEVVARTLHNHSSRANRRFLKVNCAALPSELIESELFGYERGAFTGAAKTKLGKFDIADGGTILLDEIGDMDVRLQAKLLQVLQDHEFERLGGSETIRVDVRVMAATHVDLEKAVEEGRFRADLYYRLNCMNIVVPALRDRRDEILPLAEHFIEQFNTSGSHELEITPEFECALVGYHWPGNVRELENCIRKFVVLQNPAMAASEIRLKTHASASSRVPTAQQTASAPPVAIVQLPLERVSEAQRKAESETILGALARTKWNRKQAARLLGVDYKALLYKMKKLDISGGPHHQEAEPIRERPAERTPRESWGGSRVSAVV